MKHAHRELLKLLASILVCLAISGCVVGGPKVWPRIEGAVLDKESGEPIEGAFIIIYYRGKHYYVIESDYVCYDMQVVKTDEYGKFTVKTQVEFLNRAFDREIMDVRVYKPGMMAGSIPDKFTGKVVIYMRRSSEDVMERIKSILANSVAGRCGKDGKVSAIQDEMYRQGYEEALRLAKSNEEIGLLGNMRYWIASAWDGDPDSLSSEEAEQLFFRKYEDLAIRTPRIEKPSHEVIIIEDVDQLTGSPSR